MDEWEVLRVMLQHRAVTRAPAGEVFHLASGGVSTTFIDVKPIVMSGVGSKLLSILIRAKLRPEVRCVGGLETGAIPVVQAVVGGSGVSIDGFFVRKSPKGTGTLRLIEGNAPLPRHSVTIMEDVTTRGNSAMRAVEALRELDCSVVQVITVVDREQGAAELFEENGIQFVSLFRLDDLVAT